MAIGGQVSKSNFHFKNEDIVLFCCCICVYSTKKHCWIHHWIKILIFTHTLYTGITLIWLHELVVKSSTTGLCSSVGLEPESQGRRFGSCQRAYIVKLHFSQSLLVRSKKCARAAGIVSHSRVYSIYQNITTDNGILFAGAWYSTRIYHTWVGNLTLNTRRPISWATNMAESTEDEQEINNEIWRLLLKERRGISSWWLFIP